MTPYGTDMTNITLYPYRGHYAGAVGVNLKTATGWWEWPDGSEGGTLSFALLPDGQYDLVDYDGAFTLPAEVIAALQNHGLFVAKQV